MERAVAQNCSPEVTTYKYAVSEQSMLKGDVLETDICESAVRKVSPDDLLRVESFSREDVVLSLERIL